MDSQRRAKLLTSSLAGLLFAVSLFYLLERFQWREAFALLIKAHVLRLSILILISHFLYILVRAGRWRISVHASLPNAGFFDFYWMTAVVVSLSILTPGHMGETLKIELMKRRGLLGRLPGIGAFALERAMDMVIIASMAAIGLVFGKVALPYPALKVIVPALVLLGLLFLYGLRRVHPLLNTSQWLAQLRCSSSPSTWPMIALLTILSWVLVAINWQLALRAVHVYLTLPEVLLLISLVTIGGLLSFIPGGLGVAELVTTAILKGMGIPTIPAEAGALILRAYSLVIILFGLVHLGIWLIYLRHRRRRNAANENYRDAVSLVPRIQRPATGVSSQES